MKWLLWALAGCRLSFDELAPSTDLADAPRSDGALVACPATGTPSSIRISGETFEYTNFDNGTSPVPGATIIAAPSNGMNQIVNSAGDSTYSLTVPAAGAPQRVALTYSLPGYWTTIVYTDRELDRDLVGPNMTRWQLGDGPLWGDGQMGTVHGAIGIAPDAAKGTLIVSLRDCANQIIENATVTIDPPPPYLVYLDAGGVPSTTVTTTIAPYTSAIAFHVSPGPHRVSVSTSGLAFLDLDVLVQAGKNVTIASIHPAQ